MLNVVKYKPLILLRDVQDQVNQVFETNLNERPDDASKISTNKWSLHADIMENKDQYVIYADIPGVDLKHIEVNLENHVLTIKGERNCENRSEQDTYSLVERFSGTFCRRFTLPKNVDETKINAKARNGVLTISIPKKEPQYPKKIAVYIDGDS